MRAYKFLDKQFGLKSLYERRLKIARLDDLNDPFEMMPFDLSKPDERWAVLNTRKLMSTEHGLVCFSAEWTNPVIWAHYSDKHKGICLGFEIEEIRTKRVEYIPAPLPFPSNLKELALEQQLAVSQHMLFKKYKHWEYEQEIRTWTDLDEAEDGLYYMNFGEAMRLTEVIVGARCTSTMATIERAIRGLNGVTIKKAVPCRNKFCMEEESVVGKQEPRHHI